MRKMTSMIRMLVMLLFAMALVACSAGTAATPTAAPAPTAAPEPTAVPEPNAAPEPTAAPAPTEVAEAAAEPTSAPAASSVVYRIIPSESSVQYEVGETFLNENNRYVVAVGITQEVSGVIELDLSNPQNSSIGPIEINISTFQSDNARRDNAIRNQWLESARFPVATFVPTQIDGLPSSYNNGEQLTISITGDLTIRETTRPVTFDVIGLVDGETMTGTATTQILMSDFGFEPPSILGVLRAEDEVRITFRFTARPEA
jgi:polyisoprenoid-binding protein YceI